MSSTHWTNAFSVISISDMKPKILGVRMPIFPPESCDVNEPATKSQKIRKFYSFFEYLHFTFLWIRRRTFQGDRKEWWPAPFSDEKLIHERWFAKKMASRNAHVNVNRRCLTRTTKFTYFLLVRGWFGSGSLTSLPRSVKIVMIFIS